LQLSQRLAADTAASQQLFSAVPDASSCHTKLLPNVVAVTSRQYSSTTTANQLFPPGAAGTEVQQQVIFQPREVDTAVQQQFIRQVFPLRAAGTAVLQQLVLMLFLLHVASTAAPQ
jgi:hypothetical protein